MRLDKQKFNFNLTSTGENIIRCSQVDEAFFNVFNIVLNEDVAFIKPAEKYIDGHPIIKIDVEYGNKLYENIEFKVVVDATSKSQVFINEHALLHGEQVEFECESLLQEQIVRVEELIEEPIELEPTQDWHNLEEQAKVNKESKIATFLLQIEQQLLERIDESIAQARQSIATSALGIQNKAESTIQQKVKESSSEFARLFEQWKQSTEIKINGHTIDVLKKACKHLEDQFEVVVQEQEESTFSHLSEKIFAASIETKNALHGEITNKVQELTASLQTTIKDADESLRLHVEQQLQQFNDNIVAESIKNFDDGIAAFFNKQTLWLQEASSNQIKQINESADARIDAACKTIDDAIENLQGKHGELAQQLKEHAQQTLEQAADKITTEQIKSVRECVDEVLAEQMHALEAKASDEQIISEARAAQANVFKNALGAIKTEMSNEVKSHVANLQSDLYKKFAIYAQSYAGGGTVAAQFADGGTMNGTLNVATGQILSAGIDLFDIFTGGGGSGYQTLAFNENNSALTITPFGNTVSLSSLAGGGTSGAYLPLSGGTVAGNVTVTGTLSTTTLYATSAFVTVVDITQYELSGFNVTGDVTINGQLSATTITTDYIDFTPLTGVPAHDGRLYYDQEQRTLVFWDGDPTLKYPINKMLWTIGVNKTGSIIPKGTVVYLSGAQGNRGKMWPALATDDYRSADTIGITMQATAINQEGYIMTIGQLEGIDTSGFAEGTTLYLSPTASGGITDVKPQAPNHVVKVGFSLNSTNNGKIYVEIDNGYELDELHNVRINGVTNGQVLTYNSLSALWVNTTLQTAYLPLSGGTLTGAVSTNQDIEITDSTKGIILKSPGGVKYRVTVSDAGELITTAV